MNPAISDVRGLGPATVNVLAEAGFRTVASLANTSIEKLSATPDFGEARAASTIKAAAELLAASRKAKPARKTTTKPPKRRVKNKKSKK